MNIAIRSSLIGSKPFGGLVRPLCRKDDNKPSGREESEKSNHADLLHKLDGIQWTEIDDC